MKADKNYGKTSRTTRKFKNLFCATEIRHKKLAVFMSFKSVNYNIFCIDLPISELPELMLKAAKHVLRTFLILRVSIFSDSISAFKSMYM